MLNKHQNDFIETINFLYDNFGKDVFKNISDKGEVINRFHPTIFDAIMVATYRFLKSNSYNIIEISMERKKEKELLKNPKFTEYITTRTTNLESIRGRISLAYNYLYGDSDI